MGDANEAAMHSPPPIAVLLLLCACSAHAANFGYFVEPGSSSLFGNNEFEIKQVGRVNLSTGEYVSAPNLVINTTKEGFGDDTTNTAKNRIWYLPETDELMYSFLAPRFGGYWNFTRQEQRVGVFRGPEEGPLVNANPGEF